MTSAIVSEVVHDESDMYANQLVAGNCAVQSLHDCNDNFSQCMGDVCDKRKGLWMESKCRLYRTLYNKAVNGTISRRTFRESTKRHCDCATQD